MHISIALIYRRVLKGRREALSFLTKVQGGRGCPSPSPSTPSNYRTLAWWWPWYLCYPSRRAGCSALSFSSAVLSDCLDRLTVSPAVSFVLYVAQRLNATLSFSPRNESSVPGTFVRRCVNFVYWTSYSPPSYWSIISAPKPPWNTSIHRWLSTRFLSFSHYPPTSRSIFRIHQSQKRQIFWKPHLKIMSIKTWVFLSLLSNLSPSCSSARRSSQSEAADSEMFCSAEMKLSTLRSWPWEYGESLL